MRQLVLYSNDSGEVRAKLPASLIYLDLRSAVARAGSSCLTLLQEVHLVQLVRHGRSMEWHTMQQTEPKTYRKSMTYLR